MAEDPAADSPHPQGSAPRYPPGSVKLGSVGGVAVLVRPSWFWVALLIAYLLAPRIDEVHPGLGIWKYVAGVVYAVLLYGTVLLHEMSHALTARRFGIPVRWITLHFLGGATEIDREPATPRQEWVVAVVGPITSLVVGAIALAVAGSVPDGLARMAVQSVAFTNLVLGVLNLVPGLPLDGGRVLRALVWRVSGNPHRGTIVAAWSGRVVAVLVLLWPTVVLPLLGGDVTIVDFAVTVMVAAFLWFGASASLANARIRAKLPGLRARALARRALAVPDDLPVAEAVRRAQEEGAGAIVTHAGDGRLTGVVNESALGSTPADRRPWVPVSSVARTFEDGLALPADLDGEELVLAMGRTPAAEYVLVEPDGSIYGVLSSADVDRAFAAGARR